eukprot:scaffold285502_cov26-Tisochrysis_lutea.AAC.1
MELRPRRTGGATRLARIARAFQSRSLPAERPRRQAAAARLLAVEVSCAEHIVFVLLEQPELGARRRLRPLAEVARLEDMAQAGRHGAARRVDTDAGGGRGGGDL